MIRIHKAEPVDAPAVSALLSELGYPSSPRIVAKRIASLLAAERSTVILATEGMDVLGVLALRWEPMLHRLRPAARITTLVVARAARRRGAGRLLVERALVLAHRARCEGVEVTTGVQRRDAQEFYAALGFARSSVRYYRKLRETLSSR